MTAAAFGAPASPRVFWWPLSSSQRIHTFVGWAGSTDGPFDARRVLIFTSDFQSGAESELVVELMQHVLPSSRITQTNHEQCTEDHWGALFAETTLFEFLFEIFREVVERCGLLTCWSVTLLKMPGGRPSGVVSFGFVMETHDGRKVARCTG